MLRHWKVQWSSKSKNIILPFKSWSKNLNIAIKNGTTYLSSFIAICRGSVSPSSSTMTGAHILLETSQQTDRWSRCCITVNTLVATSCRLLKLPPNKQTVLPGLQLMIQLWCWLMSIIFLINRLLIWSIKCQKMLKIVSMSKSPRWYPQISCFVHNLKTDCHRGVNKPENI